jgi:hypothetical protein
MVVLHEVDVDPGICEAAAVPSLFEIPPIIAKAFWFDQQKTDKFERF